MIGLMLYDRFNPAEPLKSQGKIDSRWHSLIDSIKLSGTVVIGTLCGFLFKSYLMLPTGINLYVLIILIFFVGIQLRNNGISLKEALFNKRGFQTGMVFTFTSLLGGIIAAFVLAMPITQGLAFASGMGWYSLSSVVLTNAWGPVQGRYCLLTIYPVKLSVYLSSHYLCVISVRLQLGLRGRLQ